jgi:thiol:disulfide interchange protein DsbD
MQPSPAPLASLSRVGRTASLCLRFALLGLGLMLHVPQAMAQTLGAQLHNEQVRAELLAHAPAGVQAGQRFWLGLRLQHQPHWHTYWQNPGDSGLPTQLQWQLPAGLQAEPLAWPVPRKIPIGDMANFGYEGELLLPVEVQVAKDFQAPIGEKLRIGLQAQWLVCRQECIPQEGKFELTLPVQAATAVHGPLFERVLRELPRPLTGAHQAQVQEQGHRLALRVEDLPAALRGQTLSLWPVTAGVMHNPARQGQDWQQSWQGTTWTANLPVSAERSESPTRMRWLLALGSESAPTGPAFEFDTPVNGTWPALTRPTSTGISPELARALEQQPPPAADSSSAWLALLGAFLGGLLLNLMPCVFPVLAIKVMGLAQPHTTPGAHRAAGLAYTAGVVASFVLLGALMLALRASGEQLGWGFQLQSPPVVIALALLFTLLGLNLAGLFEFGTWVPSRLAGLQAGNATLNAALSGVLAVAVASPCTAPFMGASLGLAVTLPPMQALAVFMAMGLGMAAPFLAASLWPAQTAWLPRPGPWMEVFRKLMAFPMLATVLWLVWVLGQQTGIDGAAALLAMLLAVAFALWALGLQGRARQWLGGLAIASLAGIAWQMLPLAWTEAAPEQVRAEPRWRPWSEAEVQSTLAAGRPVFVDFTAAWCVTCQYNKKTVLADPQVLATFEAQQVNTLRADWTRRDPAITRALAALGRSGVPVYAVYRPGRPPQVLSELPSRKDIEDALRP